uniref:PUB domain-containing protein n=1 Tax=Manihot esculenta TaxID=3983 RepID=A0A2C9U5S6_MANES
MDDMKDKFKSFMKKVNTQLSSSSSGKFKGQSRVLGGASSSSSAPTNPIHARFLNPLTQTQFQSLLLSIPLPMPLPQKTPNFDQNKPAPLNNSTPNSKPANGFDPFDSLITCGKISQNGYSLNVFECPICGQPYGSEEEVSMHVESCANNNYNNNNASVGEGNVMGESRKPPEGSVEVVLRLFRNVVREPDNAKFRKIRMGNPKIREAVSEVAGGVELLECVGFQLGEEGGEIWAVMEVPNEDRIRLINEVIGLLEPTKVEDKLSVAPAAAEEHVESKKIDTQIRVFFSVPESVAAKIELPDSFYSPSLEVLKREADARKKKIAESQLLIPKSYKEKQAKAARKRYRRTLIQSPDGVVLQSVFAPWELTSALYEFVRTSLKDPSLGFELLDPVMVKRQLIPCFPAAEERASTLEDEESVPSALIKFRPFETESSIFTGLCNELLEISEPLN